MTIVSTVKIGTGLPSVTVNRRHAGRDFDLFLRVNLFPRFVADAACVDRDWFLEMDSMSLPANTADRRAAHDAGSASDAPKPAAESRPVAGSTGVTAKPNLGDSIQALKELAAKSSQILPNGIADEPLATAYEKRIHTLQDSLKERDQVVQMLTQRLEQAADQLDRMQRTGGGRGGAATVGIPPELIESQQTLAGQMTQLLGQWEELQAASMLTRIESRINELHDLVATGSGFTPLTPRASLLEATQTSNEVDSSDSSPQDSPQKSVPMDVVAAKPAAMGWEAIKAAVLAGESVNLETISHPSERHPTPSETQGIEQADRQPLDFPTLSSPPPPVDFESADRQQLCDAIRNRDEFISMLLRRFSSLDANTEFPDWAQLNSIPEDLQQELLSLRERLQDKLRVAEVDLSLQRAKLAREEARLTIKANQLSQQTKKLGLASDELSSNEGGARALNEGSGTTQGRRWLQFLQRSAGSGSSTDGK
jgi:hypothetical protein